MWIVAQYLGAMLQSGLQNLASYLAAHVLLCLVPAFFIAGAMSALVPRESITRYLGRGAPKYISYPIAAASGSVLAVCSCTIVPLFAGIYRKGAGLGPALAFLFVAPAGNILALTYTGVILGPGFALARLILSAAFGVSIGMIMAFIFRKDEVRRDERSVDAFSASAKMPRKALVFLGLLVAVLIAGTLKVGVLTQSYGHFTLPVSGMDRFQEMLNHWVPFDASKGEEGVTIQGAILIALLVLVGVSAWFGLSNVIEGYNRWTWVALGLITLTLIVAALGMVPHKEGLDIFITGKMLAVTLGMAGIWYMGRTYFEEYKMQEFLWEAWRFVKLIFPLLVVGVCIVGAVRKLIRPEWIEALAGTNTILANLAIVFFAVFMYFPTLVEVPVANMFLSLGMHPGPLLAYLMADPELSLQSILMTSSIIGKTKVWVYVMWVALFSTLAGLLYGAWVDGTSVWIILACVATSLAVLAFGLSWLARRGYRKAAITGGH